MSRPSSRARGSVFDRLTDSSQYTGAHKHRFDANGNGRGLAGRDRISKGHGHIAGGGGNVHDLSQITRTNLNTSGSGYSYPAMKAMAYSPLPANSAAGSTIPAALSAAQAQQQAAAASAAASVASASPSYVYGGATGLQLPFTPSQVNIGGAMMGSASSGSAAGVAARSAATPSGRSTLRTSDEGGSLAATYGGRTSSSGASSRPSIFDRLTDPSQYTGAHRHRFDASGYGRGAAGRTTANAYVAAADLMKRF